MAAKKAVGRIIHFPTLPLKLLLPNIRENITEVAFKTIPSASKIEIKRVLESLYGLQVAKVNTLNMEGKKKRAKGSWAFYRRPDYKFGILCDIEGACLFACKPLPLEYDGRRESTGGQGD